jgi:hypothetical protein
MIRLPTTGIEIIDRELKRRGPFPNAEAAEAMAARLLAVWRVLQPGSGGINADDTVAFGRSRPRKP